MRKSVKPMAIILGAGVVFAILATLSFSSRDKNTRLRISENIDKELVHGASLAEMDNFMKSHTVRYDVDDRYDYQFRGYEKQSRLDSAISRKVAITLRFDPKTKTFLSGGGDVFYTGL